MTGDGVKLRGAVHAQGDVSLAEQQVFGAVGGDKLDVDAGFLAPQIGKDGGEEVVADDAAGGEANRPCQGFRAASGEEGDVGCGIAHLAGGGKKQGSGIGQAQALGDAGEKLGGTGVGKIKDVAAKDGLAEVEGADSEPVSATARKER